jgi:thiamine biosynthesis lipoprotein
MKKTWIIMGMPIVVEIVDPGATEEIFRSVFDYLTYVDETFSTYKESSEMMRINRGEIAEAKWSADMQTIFSLAEEGKQKTGGYFDIQRPDGSIDPSGVVKGWAIENATALIANAGFRNYYVNAGGDVQTAGRNAEGFPWSVGIKNPFNQNEIVKTIQLEGSAIATSGSYIRGLHIYNPKSGAAADEVLSLTVVGDKICDTDLLATAAFAMGEQGIRFIEITPGFEGYSIDKNGIATMTSGFGKYVHAPKSVNS